MIQMYVSELVKMLKSFLPVVPKKNKMEYLTRVRLSTHEGVLTATSVPFPSETDYPTMHIIGTLYGRVEDDGLPPVYVNLRDVISSLDNFSYFSEKGFVNLRSDNGSLVIYEDGSSIGPASIPSHELDADFTGPWQEPPCNLAFSKSVLVEQSVLHEMFERAAPCSASTGEYRTSIVGCQFSIEKSESGTNPLMRVICTDGRRAADVFTHLPEEEEVEYTAYYKHCVDLPAMKFMAKALDSSAYSRHMYILLDDTKYLPLYGGKEDCKNRLWFKFSRGNIAYYVLSVDKRFPFPDMDSVRSCMPKVERTFTMSKERLHRMVEALKNSSDYASEMHYDVEKHVIVMHTTDEHGNLIRFEEGGVHLDYLTFVTKAVETYGFSAKLALPLIKGCVSLDGKVTVALRDPLSMFDIYPSWGDAIKTLYHLMPIRLRKEEQ